MTKLIIATLAAFTSTSAMAEESAFSSCMANHMVPDVSAEGRSSFIELADNFERRLDNITRKLGINTSAAVDLFEAHAAENGELNGINVEIISAVRSCADRM